MAPNGDGLVPKGVGDVGAVPKGLGAGVVVGNILPNGVVVVVVVAGAPNGDGVVLKVDAMVF